MEIRYSKIDKEAVVPAYATEGSAGFDFVAIEDVVIQPQETKLVRTGIVVECPKDTALMIYPRSGMSIKTTLRLANCVGVVDSDYRGEVMIPLFNTAAPCKHQVYEYRIADGTKVSAYDKGCVPDGTVVICKGDRIAQGVIHAVTHADFVYAKEVSKTTRGKGGFGSSGK